MNLWSCEFLKPFLLKMVIIPGLIWQTTWTCVADIVNIKLCGVVWIACCRSEIH